MRARRSTLQRLQCATDCVHIEGYSLNTELRSIKRGTGTWKFPRRENNADTTTGEAILQSKWDAIASKEELIDSHCSRCRH
ncbi:beta-hexosaminidase fdl isoform X7 [Apis mellifera caucasica]|nr:beta-hexosaminidase fdl isoform X7 [Apis mellifera caucasica]KAG9430965.1 beta-hexosaminidase fdl isoform X7 [Apis mellifera carnica]